MVKSRKPLDIRDVFRKRVKDLEKERQFRQDKRLLQLQDAREQYAKSRSGRFSSKVSKGVNFLRSPTKQLYARKNPLIKLKGKSSTGRRGRPKGTYDPRYARYGGVYGYRKQLAQQLRLQRLEALRRAAVNPRQRQILNQIEIREQIQRQSPENRAIPDTFGTISTSNIMNEINQAANIFP